MLGATFAAMFPDHVERLIIDGVVEFSDYLTGRWYSNLLDTDKGVWYVLDECVAAGEACPFHANTSLGVADKIDKVYYDIEAKPFPAINGADFAVIDTNVLKKIWFTSLYKPFPSMKDFIVALAALGKGDGKPMLALHQKTELKPKCSSSQNPVPVAIQEAGTAVMCGEGLDAGRTLEDIQKHILELRNLSVFYDVWTHATRMRCAGYKIETKERFTGPFTANTSFPLLIIGNTADPVTPLAGAIKAAEGFPNSVLLTVNTPGHCSSAGTSLTASKHIRNYFREGILPPKDTICEVEDTLFGGKKDSYQILSREDEELLIAARSISKNFEAGRFF